MERWKGAEDAKTGYFCKITSLLLNMPHPVLMYGECKEKLLRKFRIQSKWYPRLERESSAKWDAGPRQCKKGQGLKGLILTISWMNDPFQDHLKKKGSCKQTSGAFKVAFQREVLDDSKIIADPEYRVRKRENNPICTSLQRRKKIPNDLDKPFK
ncbi:Retinoblastoma-Associated Protein [Manis pentadactyla]|nr:Retinoblastoma-Associated Protein [Manis pentadactyla]